MPAIPSVFRPIRSNDVQIRPFKAYKSYSLRSGENYSGSGYRVYTALQFPYSIHVGDSTYTYPVNSIDNTNQHVVWQFIDHRYYRSPYDPSATHELSDSRKNYKYLHTSASVISIPYFDVGERIKPGSVFITGSTRNVSIRLTDNGNGSLCDSIINTSSFASSSYELVHISFNNSYRNLNSSGYINNLSVKLDNQNIPVTTNNIYLTAGVTTSGISTVSGYAGQFIAGESHYISIPHSDIFNRFTNVNNWSIAFWYYGTAANYAGDGTILSKISNVTQYNIVNNIRTTSTKYTTLPVFNTNGSFNNYRTPFHIFTDGNGSTTDFICFKASNGTSELFISASATDTAWTHCAIVNTSGSVSMYINGIASGTSGSIPTGPVANMADIMIGASNTRGDNGLTGSLSEIHMYDYALNNNAILSLANRHYISGSLYQTNVAGNIFYRNGQIVVTSPLPKYNSGSGFFNNQWTASWQGTHTIYENEVMVRIPMDHYNYSMNPTMTYQPASSINSNNTIEKNNGPGVLYKSDFTGSLLKPYITTIGLYNDKAQLLAVGKLAQPVQKRDDVDMNIIVRWDY